MNKGSYLATGVIIGMALTMTTPVLAETVRTVSAKINSTVDVVINGKETKLNAQPINYNNLNYLPVGEIGRALNMDVTYDKETDTIKMDQKWHEIPAATPIVNIPTGNSTSSSNNIQSAKIGEPITKDGVTVTLGRIEYVTEKEVVDTISINNGFKLFITIDNNSSNNITGMGDIKFSTGNSIADNKLNSLGRTIFVKVNGEKYQNSIKNGQTAEGFLFYGFDGKLDSLNIKYGLDIDYKQSNLDFGMWDN